MHGECPLLPSAPPNPPQTDIHFTPEVKADVRLQTACGSWACWAELHSGSTEPHAAASQLGSPGILIPRVLDGRPPCPDPGIKGLCPVDARVSEPEGPTETSPSPLYVSGTEAQRWTWSSDHTSYTQLGLVPLMFVLLFQTLFPHWLALWKEGGWVAGLDTWGQCS